LTNGYFYTIYIKENHKTLRYIADDEILGLENIYILPTIKYLASKIFQCPKSATVSNGYAIMCKTAFEKVTLSWLLNTKNTYKHK